MLPRVGASITYFGTAVVRQLEQMDVFCANSSAGISNSRDKLRSLQILSRHRIGIPKTTFVRDKKDVLPAIERVGGAPVIIKLLEGTCLARSSGGISLFQDLGLASVCSRGRCRPERLGPLSLGRSGNPSGGRGL